MTGATGHAPSFYAGLNAGRLEERRLTGGPAFPQTRGEMPGHTEGVDAPGRGGMTLRDYFAGQALAGGTINLRAMSFESSVAAMATLAEACYEVADAMLKERAR